MRHYNTFIVVVVNVVDVDNIVVVVVDIDDVVVVVVDIDNVVVDVAHRIIIDVIGRNTINNVNTVDFVAENFLK